MGSQMISEKPARPSITEPVFAGAATGLILMSILVTTLFLASALSHPIIDSTSGSADLAGLISGGFNLLIGCLMIGIFIAFPVAWLFVGMMRIAEECYTDANSTLVWVISGGTCCLVPTILIFFGFGGSLFKLEASSVIMPLTIAGCAGGYAARRKKAKSMAGKYFGSTMKTPDW